MDNSFGVHAMVWSAGWSRQEADLAIAGSSRAGYDVIEVPLIHPHEVDGLMTAELLAKHHMKASCSLVLSPDSDISSEDPSVVESGVGMLALALDRCAEMGSTFLGGITYSALRKYPSPLSAAGRANCVAALREVAAKAAYLDIRLGLEVVNRYETNVVNTAQQALRLIDDIGSEQVVVHLDTYHMNIEENGMVAPVTACGERLGYVHIGESHRGYLGSGTVDFPSFFAALAQNHYRGTITFESFSSSVLTREMVDTLAVWRDLWTDSADLALHARRFMGALVEGAAHGM